jgi:hypothetical protein
VDRVDAEALGATDVPDPSGFGLELDGADDVPEGAAVVEGDDVAVASVLGFDEQPASVRMINRIARRFMLLERTRRAGTRQTARRWVCGVACRQAVSPHDG